MSKKKKHEQAAPDEAAEPVVPGTEAAEPGVAEPEARPAPSPEEEALEIRHLRLQADFDNYRKRTLRERAEWQLKANEELLRELLPVIDHYELGLKTAVKQGADQAVVDGFQMVYDQWLQVLRKFRVEPIETEGRLFDPHLHEAITQIPSAEHPAQTVMVETRRGYLIGGQLLRAAQVVVSSGSADEQEQPAPADADMEQES